MRMHAVLSFLAGGALLLAAASPAAAEGRVTFNDMVVQKCPQNGSLRLEAELRRGGQA